MVIAYLGIIVASVTQSATTKLYNRKSGSSAVFNAIKALSSLALFTLMIFGGFELHIPTLLFGLFYGIALTVSMYSGFRALCLGPMALTGMLVSFSIIIPLIWGITAGNENLLPLHVVALTLLLCSIVLTNWDKLFCNTKSLPQENREPKKRSYGLWLLFVIITFSCNGICSVLQKQHQNLYPKAYSREFMFFAMLLCAVIFSVISLIKASPSEIKENKGKLLGVLSGVANGFANFLTLYLAGLEKTSILFPIISAGTLLSSILCGRVFFKERLKLNHYLALVCGMLAVVLLKI